MDDTLPLCERCYEPVSEDEIVFEQGRILCQGCADDEEDQWN